MVKACNIWKQRNLTLIGRILIVKTIGISKLIYICSILHAPPHFLKQVNDYIFRYIWREKPPKVKMKTLIGEKCQGGLKMMDFTLMNKALKAMWVKRIVTDTRKEKEYLFKKWGGFLIFQCNYSTKLLDTSHLSMFYKDVLTAWEEVTNYESETHRQICSQVLWNNRFIIVEDATLCYKLWIDAGIIYLNDLLYDDGTFITNEDLHNLYGLDMDSYQILKYN